VQSNFGSSAPGSELVWLVGQESSDELVGSSTSQYFANDWSTQVIFPVAAPDATIYTIKIDGDVFAWEGLINAYGQVVTTSVNYEPAVMPEIVDPAQSDPPLIGTLYYRDDLHKVAWEYPADWSLTEVYSGVGSDAKALRLQKGTWSLIIHYKFRWDAGPIHTHSFCCLR
jgi:hypothetical protein